MSTQKIEVKYPACKHSAWTGMINAVERKITEQGHKLPLRPGPTPGMLTPFSVILPGFGLFDAKGRLTLNCNSQESADLLARKFNAEFAGY